jgi:hypothetical protein
MCEEPVYQMPDEQLLLAPHQRAGKQRAARWRGLCFDRKHAAWRVRIFYNGKQVRALAFRPQPQLARSSSRAGTCLPRPGCRRVIPTPRSVCWPPSGLVRSPGRSVQQVRMARGRVHQARQWVCSHHSHGHPAMRPV